MFKLRELIGNWLRALWSGGGSPWTRVDVADILDRYLQSGIEDDDFLNFLETGELKLDDPLVIQVQEELNYIERDYPARDGVLEFCNPEGLERVRELVEKLRSAGA